MVALVLAYLGGVYGFSLAGLPSYTRMFGACVCACGHAGLRHQNRAVQPGGGAHPHGRRAVRHGRAHQPDSELGGLARMFAVLLLIEIGSLVGNYY